jgi:hypothetical protein
VAAREELPAQRESSPDHHFGFLGGSRRHQDAPEVSQNAGNLAALSAVELHAQLEGLLVERLRSRVVPLRLHDERQVVEAHGDFGALRSVRGAAESERLPAELLGLFEAAEILQDEGEDVLDLRDGRVLRTQRVLRNLASFEERSPGAQPVTKDIEVRPQVAQPGRQLVVTRTEVTLAHRDGPAHATRRLGKLAGVVELRGPCVAHVGLAELLARLDWQGSDRPERGHEANGVPRGVSFLAVDAPPDAEQLLRKGKGARVVAAHAPLADGVQNLAGTLRVLGARRRGLGSQGGEVRGSPCQAENEGRDSDPGRHGSGQAKL